MATLSNKIEVYPQNTKEIACSIAGIADITGYIPYMTVKKYTTDEDSVLAKTGTVTDASGTVLFSLTPTDTSIAKGDYVFDITIETSTNRYTVAKDKFVVIDSVKY